MRRISLFAALSIPLALAAAACSSTGDGETDESNLTDEKLATKALQTLGAQRIAGAQQQCNKCHDINQRGLRTWQDQYKGAKANLDDPNKTAKQKVNYFRLDPDNTRSPYTPQKLGFLAGGIHLPDLPESVKLAELFKSAYGATKGAAEYKKLREAARMPISPEHDRLSKSEFKTIKTWLDKGMPKLQDLMPEAQRPTNCEDNFSDELRTHITAMKTKGWAARNKDQGVPMFACATANDPTSCFGQKKEDGKDIFPKSEDLEYARTWKAAGNTMRMIHELPHESSFWSRNSADGRFVSSGGGDDGAFVVDFAKQLETRGAERREIGIAASYDPSFMPDNSAFLIQGSGTHVCAQSLLANPATTNVSFQESQCSDVQNVSLYQSVGRRLADNEMSDFFVINNAFESDDGYGSDAAPSFGEDQKIEFKVMISTGTEGGYQTTQEASVEAPWEGDSMISPTTQLIASRISGEEKQEGYSIRKVKSTLGASGYTFEAKQIAKVCIPGGKANFSFDERYLVTHHYLNRADFASDAEWEPYKDKNTADIFLVDLQTGEKIRVTRMAPNQLALFPHFRSDGWLYFVVKDKSSDKEYYAVSDVIIGRQ